MIPDSVIPEDNYKANSAGCHITITGRRGGPKLGTLLVGGAPWRRTDEWMNGRAPSAKMMKLNGLNGFKWICHSGSNSDSDHYNFIVEYKEYKTPFSPSSHLLPYRSSSVVTTQSTPTMVYPLKLYEMLMRSSILLAATTISLILSFTSQRWQNTENAAMILYAYALSPSLALIHHIMSSLCQTRQSTAFSAGATRKQISSTTNLVCLALLAILVISSGFAVLVQSVVDFTPFIRVTQSATATNADRVTAATGFRDSLASNALVLQALLQIIQGVLLGWMFGVAAQEARLVDAIDCRFDNTGIIVHVDVEQGDPHLALSYDEADEDEDK